MKNAIVSALLFLFSFDNALADKLVVGYYPAWMLDDIPVAELDFGTLTNIVYAFAWPDSDGAIDSYAPPASPELIAAAHNAGRHVSISFGGGGQEAGFPAVIADPALRNTFIGNILDFCDSYGYDGADFDWEFPQSTDERDNYSALIRELREETDRQGRDFLISMALSAASWPNFSNDVAVLNDIVDWFFIMTYNYSGSWSQTASHHAPLYPRNDLGYGLSTSRTIEYVLETRKLARDKVVLGIPFYGRKFNASKLFGPSTGGDAMIYSAILGEIATETWTEFWDDTAKAPYLINADETKLISYDNEESVRAKCGYALEKDIAGVGVWALGYDYSDGEQPLVDIIGETLGPETVVDSEYGSPAAVPVILAGNFPNPFNPSTAVSYTLLKDSPVRIEVFNTAGQRIAVLTDSFREAGQHSVVWDASDMPSGVYLYSVSSSAFRTSGRMTLLR